MEKQGNALHCFVCGIENPGGLHLHFYQPEPGQVVANIRIPETFQGWNGVVHGGIIAAMLDEAAGRAFLTGAELDRFLFTAKLDIRYRKPVPVDTPLKLFGFAIEEKGRVVIGASRIENEFGQVFAEAEAVLAGIPEELREGMSMNPNEWQVLPDEE